MKFVLLLVVIVGGVFAFTGVPGFSEKADAPWTTFAENGGAFEAPAGWMVADPYTRSTGNKNMMWYQDIAPDGCRVAYMRAVDEHMELFLTFGPRAAMEEALDEAKERFAGVKAIVEQPVPVMQTYEGLDVQAMQVYAPVGVIAGNDMTYFMGWGTTGDNMFMIQGGSRQGGFELDTVYNVLQTITLPHD